MVEQGSLKRQSDGLTVTFNRDRYRQSDSGGVHRHPSGFVQGRQRRRRARQARDDGVFRAHEVLAKHDENYTPPEAA